MAVDISAHVPILVGIIGSDAGPDDAAAQVTTLFDTVLGELCAAHPHTPIVVLSTFTTKIEGALRQVALDRGLAVIPSDPSDVNARAHIVYFSDILVATPGPEASPDIAKVAEARAKREHAHSLRRLLAPPDIGPCFYLDGTGGRIQRDFPPRFVGDDRSEADFAASLRHRDRFNHDLRKTKEPPPGTPLARLRARTAEETRRLQRRTRAWQLTLYVLAVIGALCQLYSVLGPNVPIIVARVAAFVLAFVFWFFFVHRTDRQNRYQDYRAFSEALRVQIVWSAIGIRTGVDDFYLPMQQTELQWIRNAIRAARFFDHHTPAADPRALVVEWVDLQREYFRRTSRSEAQRRDNLGRAAFGFGILSLTMGLTTLAGFFHLLPRVGGERIGLLASAFALLVAVLQSYVRTRGYSENANRYQRMYFIFAKAHELLDEAPDETQLRSIATELGRQALAEHADWLLSQRERPIATIQAVAA